MQKIFLILGLMPQVVTSTGTDGVPRVLVATSEEELRQAPARWQAFDLETITVTEWLGEAGSYAG